MSIETGIINGDFTVRSNFQLDGVITGNVTVEAGAHFQLNGVVIQDIIVSAGASAQINGVVIGSVNNQGGNLMIKGIVKGTAHSARDDDPNAITGNPT